MKEIIQLRKNHWTVVADVVVRQMTPQSNQHRVYVASYPGDLLTTVDANVFEQKYASLPEAAGDSVVDKSGYPVILRGMFALICVASNEAKVELTHLDGNID